VEDPVDLGHQTFGIDTQMSGYDGITAGYLVRGSRPCLVETGTAASAVRVADALAGLGIGPRDLATIVVTHIHLDHAGGVGDLAEAFPEAQVVVHEAGARHLVAPERLMGSARRVFGDDVVDTVLGVLRPTPAERIQVLGDVGAIDLGDGRTLRSYHAPGHARHHVGLLDSDTGDLYVGDAAGIYVPETSDVRPATPPPDFDLDLACRSLARFRDLAPTRLLFSHFGPVADVATTLDRSEAELRLWVELVAGARRDGLDLDHAVARVLERTRERYAALVARPDRTEALEALNPTASNVAGILRYLDQVDAAME
jgi:glyoxylase-like metal-dependent hydrolase (beta-lactamase superfamily II)